MQISELTREALRRLVDQAGKPCVSIYVPLGEGGAQRDEGRIRLKNLLQEAERLLEGRDLKPHERDALMEPLRARLEAGVPTVGRETSLVLFRAPNLFESLELPAPVAPMVVVNDTFYIKPLLALLNEERRFRVLALSQNEVRVYEGDRYAFSPVTIPGLPSNLDEALYDDDSGKPLQFHTGTGEHRTGAQEGDRPGAFHGQAPGKEDAKERVLRYCQLVNDIICKHFSDQDVPLIIAGPEPVPSRYREANGYRTLHAEAINGNPSLMKESELHHEAWRRIAQHSERERAAALERLREYVAKDRGTADVPSAVAAACNSRIDTLFVDPRRDVWGTLKNDQGEAAVVGEPGPNTEELTNLAVVQTLRHGGAAQAATSEEIPGDAALAAAYRY